MAKRNWLQRLIKSLSPWDVDDNVGWVPLWGNQKEKDIDTLAQRVPWLYRAYKDRANNVSHMPWVIESGGEDNEIEIANSAEWAEQKPADLEFLSNPRQLLSQIEQSLTVAGKAYCALTVNSYGYIKDLTYVNPNSIDEVYDKATGALTGYERSISGRKDKCSMADQKPVPGQVQIVAIYDPDYLTEQGPGKTSAAVAALTAAGVLYSYDKFVTNYFERGAIKATVLSVEGASQSEQERLQHWWDDVIGGVKNAWSAIVLRGSLNKPIPIGEGMEGIKDNDLSTARRQDIATALGIPESRLWSAAANMATRREDEMAYFRGTIIPECDLIAEAFNEQVFNAIHNLDGYRWEFQPERLDVFKEDDTEKGAQLKLMTDSGVPLLIALAQAGYDLTDEQTEELTPTEGTIDAPRMTGFARAIAAGVPMPVAMVAVGWEPSPEQLATIKRLEAELAPPKPEPVTILPAQAPPQLPPGEQKPPAQQPPPPAPATMTPAMTKELDLWRQFAVRRFNKGQGKALDFECKALPEDIASGIRVRLEAAQDECAIVKAFEIVAIDDWYQLLSEATQMLKQAMEIGG